MPATVSDGRTILILEQNYLLGDEETGAGVVDPQRRHR